MTPRQIKNFWAKVDKTPGHGPCGECWVWTGGTVGGRYGRLGLAGVGSKLAHHVAWFLATGEWPERGVHILHTPLVCGEPACVRFEHLREGNPSENAKDRVLDGRDRNANKTHCLRGHPFDAENTYFTGRGNERHCKTCKAEASKRYYVRRKALRAAHDRGVRPRASTGNW